MKESIEKTLRVNERQKEFYNSNSNNKNLSTRIWSKIRNGLLHSFRKEYDISSRVYNEHKIWLGDLSDKKILDLGCLKGNALSIYMAKNAKEYIGIDLSENAIEILNNRIVKVNCKNAKAIAIDFLSDDFNETDFDIIYAYGVLHHFKDIDVLISKLKEKLCNRGVIISYDPLETSFPVKLARLIYRPFQSDKDWEWPFNKSTLKKFDDNFVIKERRGILGSSKYGILISLLPFSKSFKDRIIGKMIENDWNISIWKDVHKCMHLTMLLKKE